MTTVRIRKARAKTIRELVDSGQIGARTPNPVEVLVFGSLRAIVAFPQGKAPTVAWVEAGWQAHKKAFIQAASSARALSSSTEKLWKGERTEAAQEVGA